MLSFFFVFSSDVEHKQNLISKFLDSRFFSQFNTLLSLKENDLESEVLAFLKSFFLEFDRHLEDYLKKIVDEYLKSIFFDNLGRKYTYTLKINRSKSGFFLVCDLSSFNLQTYEAREIKARIIDIFQSAIKKEIGFLEKISELKFILQIFQGNKFNSRMFDEVEKKMPNIIYSVYFFYMYGFFIPSSVIIKFNEGKFDDIDENAMMLFFYLSILNRKISTQKVPPLNLFEAVFSIIEKPFVFSSKIFLCVSSFLVDFFFRTKVSGFINYVTRSLDYIYDKYKGKKKKKKLYKSPDVNGFLFSLFEKSISGGKLPYKIGEKKFSAYLTEILSMGGNNISGVNFQKKYYSILYMMIFSEDLFCFEKRSFFTKIFNRILREFGGKSMSASGLFSFIFKDFNEEKLKIAINEIKKREESNDIKGELTDGHSVEDSKIINNLGKFCDKQSDQVSFVSLSNFAENKRIVESSKSLQQIQSQLIGLMKGDFLELIKNFVKVFVDEENDPSIFNEVDKNSYVSKVDFIFEALEDVEEDDFEGLKIDKNSILYDRSVSNEFKFPTFLLFRFFVFFIIIILFLFFGILKQRQIVSNDNHEFKHNFPTETYSYYISGGSLSRSNINGNKEIKKVHNEEILNKDFSVNVGGKKIDNENKEEIKKVHNKEILNKDFPVNVGSEKIDNNQEVTKKEPIKI